MTNFKAAVLAIGFITTMVSQPPNPTDKKYKVEFTLQEWGVKFQQIDYIKNTLRQSDLPSRQVAFITDSLLTPLQQEISLQVNQQVAAEKPKTDSTTKQNKKQ